jgi:arylsulfatase A-like enzyme
LVNRYDANLRYADWAVGELLGELKARRLLKKTLFILTSDHGEAFGEHGYTWHPSCPFEETLHIPLLVRFGDGRPSGRVSALTQSIDILPTIYDLLQLPVPRNTIQGTSLLPLLTGRHGEVHRFIFSRTSGMPSCYVVHDLRSALLMYEGGKLRALYDLDADPRQQHNIATQEAERMREMTAAFGRFTMTQRTPPLQFLGPVAEAPARGRPDQAPMTKELRDELKALGYLQ